MVAVARGLDVTLELRARLADLYCAYDDALNDGELERWPELFTDACVYKVIPRENHEQGFPIALIYCESRDMLVDRVVALRETALYAPRIVRRITSAACLRAIENDVLRVTANFALFRTRPGVLDTYAGRYRLLLVPDAEHGYLVRLRRAELVLDALRPHGKVSVIL